MNLKLYWQRRRVFKQILSTYRKAITGSKNRFRFLENNPNFENLMQSSLNGVNETIFTGSEREFFVENRVSYNKIVAKRQMLNINYFLQDDSEVRNNVKRINRLLDMIYRTEKKMKSHADASKYLIKLEAYAKLHASQMAELIQTCSHLKNILSINVRQSSITELLQRINSEYEKFLQFSLKEMQILNSSESLVSKSMKFSSFDAMKSNFRASRANTNDFAAHDGFSKNKSVTEEESEVNGTSFSEVFNTIDNQQKHANKMSNGALASEFQRKQFTLPNYLSIKTNPPKVKEANRTCSALCDYDGEGRYLPMREGENIKIVRQDSIGFFGKDANGAEQLINTQLVNISY
ncbi:MAG: hypothetical protein MHMPM18_001286 [Marteilia pararefringens]